MKNLIDRSTALVVAGVPDIPPPKTRRDQGLELADEFVLERIPAVAGFVQCCKVLAISRSSAYRMRRDGTFPVPEMSPPFPDNKPRFAGEAILAEIRRRARNGREPRRRRA